MIFQPAPSRKATVLLLAGVVATAAFAQTAETDAESILQAARLNPLGEPIRLLAQLRSGQKTTPFQIVVAEGKVRYEFQNPTQVLTLELGDKDSTLSESVGRDRTATVRPARFDEKVRGAEISYEDLALKFLYWKNPTLLGREKVRSRPAWKIEIQAPRGRSQYGVARLWVDTESGALLRMEGYDRQGKLVRRFEVISAQKLEGQWMLKQMRIESLDPSTRKTTGRTYLEVLDKV